MMWLMLEAGVAGLLLVLIVWWTLPSKKSEAAAHGTGATPSEAKADEPRADKDSDE